MKKMKKIAGLLALALMLNATIMPLGDPPYGTPFSVHTEA